MTELPMPIEYSEYFEFGVNHNEQVVLVLFFR